MDKFSRHLGKPGIIELENENGDKDTFELKPLPFEYLKDFYMIGKAFAGIPANSPSEKYMEAIDENTIELMKKIVMATLENSYPDTKKETLEEFASRNFMMLLQKIFEINGYAGAEIEKVSKKIDKIKEIQNVGKIQENKG